MLVPVCGSPYVAKFRKNTKTDYVWTRTGQTVETGDFSNLNGEIVFNDCLIINPIQSYKWSSSPCDEHMHTICQRNIFIPNFGNSGKVDDMTNCPACGGLISNHQKTQPKPNSEESIQQDDYADDDDDGGGDDDDDDGGDDDDDGDDGNDDELPTTIGMSDFVGQAEVAFINLLQVPDDDALSALLLKFKAIVNNKTVSFYDDIKTEPNEAKKRYIKQIVNWLQYKMMDKIEESVRSYFLSNLHRPISFFRT